MNLTFLALGSLRIYPSFAALYTAVALDDHAHLLLAKFAGYSVMMNVAVSW